MSISTRDIVLLIIKESKVLSNIQKVDYFYADENDEDYSSFTPDEIEEFIPTDLIRFYRDEFYEDS